MEKTKTIELSFKGDAVTILLNQSALSHSLFYLLILSPDKHDNILAEKKRVANDVHILEGILLLSRHADRTIDIIRSSSDEAEAIENLIKNFEVDELQACQLLQMDLADVFKLDYHKIRIELIAYGELLDRLYQDTEVGGNY